METIVRNLGGQLDPIRIGDTLQRTYLFYNPIFPLTNPPQPDRNNPKILDMTITFNIKNDLQIRSFGTGTGVIVVSLEGSVTVRIPTDIWDEDFHAESYLEFTYSDGTISSWCHLYEQIIPKELVI